MRGYRELTADDNTEDWLDYYCGWKVSNKPEVLEAAARAAVSKKTTRQSEQDHHAAELKAAQEAFAAAMSKDIQWDS